LAGQLIAQSEPALWGNMVRIQNRQHKPPARPDAEQYHCGCLNYCCRKPVILQVAFPIDYV
jgi:hypothetical protein